MISTIILSAGVGLLAWLGLIVVRRVDDLRTDLDRLRLALGDNPEDALARVAMSSRDCVTFQARVGEVERRLRELDDAGLLGFRDDCKALFLRVATMRGNIDMAEAGIEALRKELRLHEAAAGGAFWKTEDGRVLRVRDMSDRHLERVLGSPGIEDAPILRGLMQAERHHRALGRELDRQMDELETEEES